MNRRDIKTKLVESIDDTVEIIISGKIDDKIFNEILMIKARKRDLDMYVARNVLPQIEINIELNKIRGSVLYLIDKIDDSFFEEQVEVNIQEYSEEIIEVNEEVTEFDEDVDQLDLSDFLELDDYGIFDVEELLFEKTDEFKQNLERLVEINEELGNGITLEANKLDKINRSNSPNKRSLQKAVSNDAARVMKNYTNRMNVEIPIFKKLTEDTVKFSMLYVLKIYEGGLVENREGISSYKEAVESLLITSSGSRNELFKMYEELKRIPNLTSYFGFVKKKVATQLKDFLKINDNYISELNTLFEAVKMIYLELPEEE